MQDEIISWTWGGQAVPVAATRLGTGPRALLLPALSSISTRAEMAPLQAILAERFETLAVNWPGFGTADKTRMAWEPAGLTEFLAHVMRQEAPAIIVAAGHAAGYVLRHVAAAPEAAPHLALIAPTWRGPLPTMMRRRPGWLARVVGAVDMPGLGPLLYRLNLSDPVIRMMARAHVYSDPAWLTPAGLAEKRRVARARAARFASVRFVSGALDPFDSGEAFRAAAAGLPRERLQVIWGAEAPPKSRAEMEALAEGTSTRPTVLPRGKLGLHEEFPAEVAAAILSRLDEVR